MVGSDESPSYHVSRIATVSRACFVDLAGSHRRSTKASLLFHVVGLDQMALKVHVERFGHCGRSGALQPAVHENDMI